MIKVTGIKNIISLLFRQRATVSISYGLKYDFRQILAAIRYKLLLKISDPFYHPEVRALRGHPDGFLEPDALTFSTDGSIVFFPEQYNSEVTWTEKEKLTALQLQIYEI